MKKWEKFEKDCVKFLKKEFGNHATFDRQGGSDPTIPDIKVTLENSGKVFYIEVKQAPARCGQFVVLPDDDNKTFVFSDKNKSENNNDVQQIIAHMEQEFDKFNKVATEGGDEKIEFEGAEQVFINWIINYYKTKNVKFFITNGYALIPIDQFGNYFKVTATYRKKKSGSGKPTKKNFKDLKTYVKKEHSVSEMTQQDDSTVIVNSCEDLDGKKFILADVDTYRFIENKAESTDEGLIRYDIYKQVAVPSNKRKKLKTSLEKDYPRATVDLNKQGSTVIMDKEPENKTTTIDGDKYIFIQRAKENTYDIYKLNPVPNKSESTLQKQLEARLNCSVTLQDSKLIVKSGRQLDGDEFRIQNTYRFRREEDGTYELRRLGETDNPNVIFKIKLVPKGISHDKFVEALQPKNGRKA